MFDKIENYLFDERKKIKIIIYIKKSLYFYGC